MQLAKEGNSRKLFIFSFFVFVICAYLVVSFLVKTFPRNYYKVEQLSSMKSEGTYISPHERTKLLEIMTRIRENSGLTLSFHVAEVEPLPRIYGPNSFTIAISVEKQTVKYRAPYAFREMLGVDEYDIFMNGLQVRYRRCLDLPITRKIAHCLEDSMIAIEEKTKNHPRANLLIIPDNK